MELTGSFVFVISTTFGLIGIGLLVIVGIVGAIRWKQLEKVRKLQRELEEKRVQYTANYLRNSKLTWEPLLWINSAHGFSTIDPPPNYFSQQTLAITIAKISATALDLFWDRVFYYYNYYSRANCCASSAHKVESKDKVPKLDYTTLFTGIEGRTAIAKMLTKPASNAATNGNLDSTSRIVELPNFLSEEECDQILEEREELNRFESAEFGTGFHKEIDRSRKTCTAFVHPLGKVTIIKNQYDRANTWRSQLIGNSNNLANSSNDSTKSISMLEKLAKMVRPFMGMDDCMSIGTLRTYYAETSSQYGAKYHRDRGLYTLIVYLNDVPLDAQGGTDFITLGVRVQPRKGWAVWFRNYTPIAPITPDIVIDHQNNGNNGSINSNNNYNQGRKYKQKYKLDEKMMHCGERVLKDEKCIVQFLAPAPLSELIVEPESS